jgi:hypothetical protein
VSETYSQKLRDPRWQKKRLEIFNRDEWACTICKDTTTELQVHHLRYIFGKSPWDYENEMLQTLCSKCHQATHFASGQKQLIKETVKVELPFDSSEAQILKLLLLYGDLTIAPRLPIPKNRHTKIYELIISEFVKYHIQFESKDLQQVYDAIAYKFYNQPGFIPDVEEYLTSENDVIRSFSSYLVESNQPISPSWAQFGIFPPVDTDQARKDAISLVFFWKLRKVQKLRDEKCEMLKGGDSEEMKVLGEIQELDKKRLEIQSDKMNWI